MSRRGSALGGESEGSDDEWWDALSRGSTFSVYSYYSTATHAPNVGSTIGASSGTLSPFSPGGLTLSPGVTPGAAVSNGAVAAGSDLRLPRMLASSVHSHSSHSVSQLTPVTAQDAQGSSIGSSTGSRAHRLSWGGEAGGGVGAGVGHTITPTSSLQSPAARARPPLAPATTTTTAVTATGVTTPTAPGTPAAAAPTTPSVPRKRTVSQLAETDAGAAETDAVAPAVAAAAGLPPDLAPAGVPDSAAAPGVPATAGTASAVTAPVTGVTDPSMSQPPAVRRKSSHKVPAPVPAALPKQLPPAHPPLPAGAVLPNGEAPFWVPPAPLPFIGECM